MALSLNQFVRFFIAPLNVEQAKNTPPIELNDWNAKSVCLKNCLIVTKRDLKNECYDVINGIIQLGQTFSNLLCWNPKACQNHFFKVLDFAGACAIRPVATFIDLIKLLAGAIFKPALAIKIIPEDPQKAAKCKLIEDTIRLHIDNAFKQECMDKIWSLVESNPEILKEFQICCENTKDEWLRPAMFKDHDKHKLVENPFAEDWRVAQRVASDLDKKKYRWLKFLEVNPDFALRVNPYFAEEVKKYLNMPLLDL